ncbi:hypothetical protein ACODT4_39940 [Streptomyces sp. 2.9]|uniref:hypothetical protein n=1 Tax=Streptomyces tritrimontium TaxID=3406573 RepID=UPI003BB73787
MLMRQVHEFISAAEPALSPARDTPAPATVPQVSPAPEPAVPVTAPAPAKPLVICGGHLHIPPVPQLSKSVAPVTPELPAGFAPNRVVLPAPRPVICMGHLDIPAVPPRPRLGTAEANAAIEAAWKDGLSVREAARISTRSPAQVQRVYTRLDTERDDVSLPVPQQQELEGIAA